MPCRTCHADSIESTYVAREMMNGSGKGSAYFACRACGCRQIAGFPADVAPYHSQSYYSVRPHNPVKRYLQDQRTRCIAGSGGGVGWAVAAVKPPESETSIAPEGVSRESGVPEVGCSNRYSLQKRLELGFRRLAGIDPFMDAEHVRDEPVLPRRLSIPDRDPGAEQNECIVHGHTFAHIAEKLQTLAHVRALMQSGGLSVLQIPRAGSNARDNDRTDRVQLDAPRHFHLHTGYSLQILAERARALNREGYGDRVMLHLRKADE